MPEFVVRRVRDETTEAHRQREEALSDGGVPDVGLDEFRPVWLYEEDDTVDGAFEGHRAYQQRDHYDVGEDCEEVGRLATTARASDEHTEDAQPGEE